MAMDDDHRDGEVRVLLRDLEQEIEAIRQALEPPHREESLIARLDRDAPRTEPEAPSGSTLRQRLARIASS
jgi:hypothetical protein